MFPAVNSGPEALLAEGALVGLHAHVCRHVPREAAIGGEGGVADAAAEGLDPCGGTTAETRLAGGSLRQSPAVAAEGLCAKGFGQLTGHENRAGENGGPPECALIPARAQAASPPSPTTCLRTFHPLRKGFSNPSQGPHRSGQLVCPLVGSRRASPSTWSPARGPAPSV